LGGFTVDDFVDTEDEAKFLRILWCDNGNMIRSKALRLKKNQTEQYVGISQAQQAVPVTYDGVVPGSTLDPVGEVYLYADQSTIHKVPYAQGNIMAIGDMYVNGSPWEYCPRNYLKKMIGLADERGLSVKSAFENEFYLLNGGPFQSGCVEETPFASTSSMNLNNDVVMEIVDSLESQEVFVEQYYPESGPCQQEITVEYTDALQSCDNQIIFRETVRGVALKNNRIASFLPKIFQNYAGNGCHIHLSLWNNHKNVTHDPEERWGISKQANHFIAGILEHINSIMAITTPISNSYKRIIPKAWAGKFKCWGLDNREASIRVIREPDGNIKHFEFKTSDATANPYLALGAIIRAGIDGVDKELELPEPVQLDPSNMNEAERIKNNITDLPSSPAEAIEALENDDVLIDSLGDGLSKAFIAVKKEEWRMLKVMDMEKEVNLLLNRY
jgi:glutamine synthetase